MKSQLTEYLMSHGVLKNADAQTMAEEIIDMLGVGKLKAQLDSVQKANAELREFALSHFSREQVKPLLEALQGFNYNMGPRLDTDLFPIEAGSIRKAAQAIARARAVGMEEK